MQFADDDDDDSCLISGDASIGSPDSRNVLENEDQRRW